MSSRPHPRTQNATSRAARRTALRALTLKKPDTDMSREVRGERPRRKNGGSFDQVSTIRGRIRNARGDAEIRAAADVHAQQRLGVERGAPPVHRAIERARGQRAVEPRPVQRTTE